MNKPGRRSAVLSILISTVLFLFAIVSAITGFARLWFNAFLFGIIGAYFNLLALIVNFILLVLVIRKTPKGGDKAYNRTTILLVLSLIMGLIYLFVFLAMTEFD